MTPVLLITRPDPGGAEFEAAVRDRFTGPLRIVHSPLLRIEPVGGPLDLGDATCLIFTSRAGVTRFARITARRDLLAYCVGDATAQAAADIGLRAVSCKGDADALIARILADGVKGSFLHLRGRHARGEITSRLVDEGLSARDLVIYDQVEHGLTQPALDLLQRELPVILPLFSPRTARQFADQIKGRAPLWIVAMSAAVAEHVAELQPARLEIAKRPDLAAMLDATEGLLDAANRLEG